MKEFRITAKLVNNLTMPVSAGGFCRQTLGSRRSLASSSGRQIMARQASGDHCWKVSTAASDAEQERVLHPACPCIWLPLTLTPLPASFAPKEV